MTEIASRVARRAKADPLLILALIEMLVRLIRELFAEPEEAVYYLQAKDVIPGFRWLARMRRFAVLRRHIVRRWRGPVEQEDSVYRAITEEIDTMTHARMIEAYRDSVMKEGGLTSEVKV
jgi:hypothetical protein